MSNNNKTGYKDNPELQSRFKISSREEGQKNGTSALEDQLNDEESGALALS